MITIVHFDGDGNAQRAEEGALAELVAGPGFVWVDLESPTSEEQQLLRHPALDLDPLIIEDMTDDRHLPKVEAVGRQLALVIHAVRLGMAAVELDTTELDLAILPNCVVTVHDEELASIGAVRHRVLSRGAAHVRTPVQLVHLVLDTVNDIFVPFVDHIERRLDVIEADLMSDPTEDTRRDIYELQRDLIQLRRAVVPQAEVIRRLGGESHGLIDEPDRRLFRDLYDHLFRMSQLSESYQQLLDSAVQSYRSARDDQLNQMLNTLTMISAVLLPISVIAGIYGTNFVNIPELEVRWAYFAMWGVFAVIVTGMLLWFRRRGWLGDAAGERARSRRSGLAAMLEIPLHGRVLQVPVAGTRAIARTGLAVAKAPWRLAVRAARAAGGEGDSGAAEVARDPETAPDPETARDPGIARDPEIAAEDDS